MPILVFGLIDQNYTSQQLLTNLHLYRTITRNARMSWIQFFKWNFIGNDLNCENKFYLKMINQCVFLTGLWHSVAIYFGCMLLWQSDPAFLSSGQTLDYGSFGTLVYHDVIFIVSLKVCFHLVLFNYVIHTDVFGLVNDGIASLDCTICAIDPDLCTRVHGTNVLLLCIYVVSLLLYFFYLMLKN